MDYSSDPTPEERGQLGPPARRPPTAIGVATPPPPHGPQRRRLNIWAGFGRLYAFSGACVGLGTLAGLLAPWEFVRGGGLGAAGAGALVGAVLLWIRSGAQSRWSLWRRSRWIRKRRRIVGRAPRPSA
jgi:hypothetical protein